ncbi:YdcF family protein [Chthonobacter rhizosphaerae]|uniref:YdcF family protein n=1 Tax=Chthonobacter rhizosphaerae TaxID=2735553 RepID=UPI001AEE73DE|nr:YdcF family protein [Chthonobacter rhizosphaerae]
MSALADPREDRPADAARPAPDRQGAPGDTGLPPWVRHAAVTLVCLGLFGTGMAAGGFLSFAQTVSRLAATAPIDADGIVVLTGGAERIAGAIDLLAGGHARRLLISGVHPETSARQIGKVLDAGPSLFDCCVDLDRRAANTIGNAEEAAKWARRHGFQSLIVVTSAYHMPRSLAELSSTMPEVDLKPYPVARDRLGLEHWYGSRETLTLLLEEYLKYMATRARLAFATADGMPARLAALGR